MRGARHIDPLPAPLDVAAVVSRRRSLRLREWAGPLLYRPVQVLHSDAIDSEDGGWGVIFRIPSLTRLVAITCDLSACATPQQSAIQARPSEHPTSISIVLSVSGGDTLSAVVNGIPEKIRLTGIDCPEHAQPFAKEATQIAKQLALEKAVRVAVKGRDKWNRLLGEGGPS